MRFSVIIPLYNKGPYIQKALESVLHQTGGDYEIVVVDDGSTDGSYDTAKSILEGSHVPFRLMHQANMGVSTARNNGVAASSGDYLCFLDGDDWWEPTFLEKIDGLIKAFPDAGIYGSNYYIVKGGSKRIALNHIGTGYINYCRAYTKMRMPLWTGAVCIPRKVFEESGGFRPHLKLGEDFDLWIRISLKNKVAFLNDPQSFYNQDSDAQWRGVGKLRKPETHMLWNLDYLAEEEKTNPDYKRLIDEIRTYSLFPYYLSDKYRQHARKELDKVDWSLQPPKVRRLYRLPVPILKLRQRIRVFGSSVKRHIKRHK